MSAAASEGWLLQVSAGTGPVEVRHFVARLAAHLATRCAAEGAPVRGVIVHGDASAPRSVDIHLGSAPAPILALAGTHALVARSANRGKHARKRWYAGVRLHAVAEESAAPELDPREVEITAMRAGGPGGQHVNKTASAVRARHLPSGVTVRVADERSQHANVRVALARLARAVADQADARARGARDARRLSHFRVERGRPVRVYEEGPGGGLIACDGTCSR